MKNIFVSYNFDDRNLVHSIKAMSKSNGGTLEASFKLVNDDVSVGGSFAIDKEIRRVMEGCSIALFIVGDNNHNSPWINREAEIATSRGIDIVIMKLIGASGGIPNVLRGRVLKECSWGGRNLSEIIN